MFLPFFFATLLVFGLYFNDVNTSLLIRNTEDENSKKLYLLYIITEREKNRFYY